MTKRTRVWSGEDVQSSLRDLVYPLCMVVVAILGAGGILWYAMTHV